MRVVLDFYYDDLEQRCTSAGCRFTVGPYSEPWHGSCPRCQGRVGFFRAFGTEAERAAEVEPWEGRLTA